jgi:hypothetical protein
MSNRPNDISPETHKYCKFCSKIKLRTMFYAYEVKYKDKNKVKKIYSYNKNKCKKCTREARNDKYKKSRLHRKSHFIDLFNH